MQTNSNVSNADAVENQQGITSIKASEIADHYRKLGGFKIEISEHQFRSNILVTPLSTVTTYQAREVN